MSDTRIKNSTHSMMWMMIFLSISSIAPLIIRSLIIRYMGMEYAGLNSLFMSIMQIFNITELGIGEALVFYLYKPMAEKDEQRVNALLNLYRKVYMIIGAVFALLSAIMIPFLPYLVKEGCPDEINLLTLYLIYVINTLCAYFYKSYVVSVFQTNQSLYYDYMARTIVWIFAYAIQFFAVIKYHNYYIFAVSNIFATLALNALDYIIIRIKYPNYRPEGKIEKSFFPEFIKKVSAMSFMKIRNMLRLTFDTVVISSLLGLTALAKYNNYYMIMLVPLMITTYFRQSILQSLGNSVALESKESNRGVVKLYSFCLQGINVVFSSALLCGYHDFITLWVGEESVFNFRIEILFVLYYYVRQMTDISELIRNSTGIWWQGKWVPLAETITNLVLNIVFASIWGIEGVLWATIISIVVVNIPFETYYVFNKYFNDKIGRILVDYLINGLLAILIIGVSYILSSKIIVGGLILQFILKAMVATVISAMLFMILHIKDGRMKDIIEIFMRMISRKDSSGKQ